MKNIIILLIAGMLFSCNAQQKITATKNNQGDLEGIANKASFEQEPFKSWFITNYTNYKPDETVVKNIKNNLKGITIKGFMGTWCGDSRRETPHFYHILDKADFNYKNLELITVNRSKKTPNNLQEGYNIFKVPTFIFYKNNKEIGRFVEYPRKTLEKDILKIISEQNYKHSYQN